MSDPANLTAREDAIRRLRELHDAAGDADRPRGELAADALSRLDGLDDDSPETAALAERLRGYLPAEPESIQLGGGDLNWDVDWAALQGPAESAKSVLDMLPFMASMLPPQAPVRQALTSITDVLQAYEREQWTPQRDRSLKTAIEQVEAGGLGAGLAMTLRLIAMTIRVQRCQQVAEAGGQPQWPSLAELDALIAGFEAADDLSESLGGPFQAIDGLHHMYIAVAISMRLFIDTKRADVRRDAAWRDNVLRLLDQADEHLRQMPPAYGGMARDLRGKLGSVATSLRTGTMPPSPPAARKTPTAPAPPSAAPAPAPPAPAPPAPAPPASSAATGAWDNIAAMGQYSARAFDGLQILTGMLDDPVAKGIGGMLLALEATNSRRWTPEYDQRLAELERQAGGPAENGPAAQRFMLAGMLALMHATRYQQRSASLRSADHPPASELAAVIAETESALEVGREATASEPNPMVTEVSAILRAQVAMMLVDLSQFDHAHRAELLARARAHFDQVPAEMMDRLPVIRNMAVLEQLIEGRIEPDDDAIKSVIDVQPDAWDRSGSDLKPALATADRARRSQRPEDIAAALLELQAVWVRLSAGNPMRARVLVPIAMQRALLAARTGSQQTVVDAASTAIAALGAAVTPAERDAAAQLTVNVLIQMLSRGQFGGPFLEAEEAARGALAALGGDDWAPRLSLLTATGAAMAMRAHAQHDETLSAAARQVIAEAGQLADRGAGTGGGYPAGTAASGGRRGAAGRAARTGAGGGGAPPRRSGRALPAALRPGRAERPGSAARHCRRPAPGTGRRHRRRPAAAADPPDARHLPRRADPADPAERTEQTLQEAVSHLNHALTASAHATLTASAHATPTVEWADTLQYLARCQREVPGSHDDASGPGTAERTMRAALRELARCVMTAETTDEALDVAAAANEIVARTISWCLVDDRHRAAIDIAEAGRGLVLASVVLSGRVEEVLRGSGNPAAADAWRTGGEAGPAGRDAAAETDGHAILLRPVLGEVEVIPLPGLSGADGDTPLGAYLAALDGALSVSDLLERGVDGFRGGPRGQAWADALEELGSWTYQRIIGPLLEHVRTWSLNHQPHLVLVPLGELGAIPYAAAWTGDGSASAEVYGIKSERNGPATVSALLGALPGRDRPGASLLQLSTHGTAQPAPALQAKDGWLPNLAPVIGSLQPTKDAVLRVGALLIVKVDWAVSVFQLTAAQQARLDHHPQLASTPREIVAALQLASKETAIEGAE
jgi:hypothetical protein